MREFSVIVCSKADQSQLHRTHQQVGQLSQP